MFNNNDFKKSINIPNYTQRPYIVGWRFDRIESLVTAMVTFPYLDRMLTRLHFSDVYID